MIVDKAKKAVKKVADTKISLGTAVLIGAGAIILAVYATKKIRISAYIFVDPACRFCGG